MFKRVRDSELARVLSLIGPRIWTYVLSVLVVVVTLGVCFNIILAFIMKDMLDAAGRGENALVIRAAYIAGGTLLVGLPLLGVSGYVKLRCVTKTMSGIRIKVFDHLEDLTVESIERQHSGGLISRCTNDLQIIEGIYSDQVYALVLVIVVGLIAVTAIFTLEWRIGLPVLLVGAITIFTTTAFAGPLRRASDRIQKHLGTSTERLTDLLHGLRVTKMFHLEQIIHRLYAQANEEMSRAAIERARLNALLGIVNYLLSCFRDIGFLALALFVLIQGSLELGALVAIVQLQVFASYFLFSNIGPLVAGLQGSLAGAGRVFELLDSPVEPERYTYPEVHGMPTRHEGAMVEFRDVTFCYEGDRAIDETLDTATTAMMLQGINLSVERGEVAALVGPSGGGKSTIIKLLLGFYPIEGGIIRVDGKSLGQYSLAQLRDMMAYVPQDAYLFDATIEENIRYGRPDATHDEVIAAARMANAHDFILEQPDAYNTVVGERGAKLSGGQRQRVAIARALLKDAPILLLDEATSALDSESEQLVQEALSVLMEGRTTIAIAHRFSTVENADILYVIRDGRVVEQGGHNELVVSEGLYSSLYRLQFRQDRA